jgi:hypothetical protein
LVEGGPRPRRGSDISMKVIKESAIRSLVKILLEDKSLGPALIKVNPVVDPSAALTDPGNPDFKPNSKPELKAALSAVIDDVADEKIPDVYDSIKNSMSVQDDSKEVKKMSNKRVEEAIRRQIKKIISQAFLNEALPSFPRPKPVQPSNPLGPVSDVVDTKGMSAAERKNALSRAIWAKTKYADEEAVKRYVATKGITKIPSGVGKVATKPSEKTLSSLRASLDSSSLGSEEDQLVGGKKNESGDVTLDSLTGEFGFKNPNGVKQFIDKVLQKVKHRMEYHDVYELATVEAMNDYINGFLSMGVITPQDAELMKQNPQFVGQVSIDGTTENPEDEGSFFRTKFLAPRLRRLEKVLMGAKPAKV